jgi:hypothetical protein
LIKITIEKYLSFSSYRQAETMPSLVMPHSLSTLLISLGLVTTINVLPAQSLPSLTKQSSPQQDLDQLSQNRCLEVSAKGSGLYVHSEPTVYSEALRILPDGQQVTPVNNQLLGNGWLQISAPMSGYVFAGFLRPCQADSTL